MADMDICNDCAIMEARILSVPSHLNVAVIVLLILCLVTTEDKSCPWKCSYCNGIQWVEGFPGILYEWLILRLFLLASNFEFFFPFFFPSLSLAHLGH